VPDSIATPVRTDGADTAANSQNSLCDGFDGGTGSTAAVIEENIASTAERLKALVARFQLEFGLLESTSMVRLRQAASRRSGCESGLEFG
jgi:hypothetical protein